MSSLSFTALVGWLEENAAGERNYFFSPLELTRGYRKFDLISAHIDYGTQSVADFTVMDNNPVAGPQLLPFPVDIAQGFIWQ